MRYSVALLAAVCLVAVFGVSGHAARQAQTVSPTPSDLLAARAEILKKNLTMTDEQAAKFWPAYEAYQKEHGAIMDEQAKGIQRYIESFDKLDDAGALALMKAHLDRDERIVALRQKALVDLQRVVGTKLAARAIQIDRRLTLAYQLQIVSKIPLIR